MSLNHGSAATDAVATARHADRLDAAAALLRGASQVTIVCHENPDADTLGGGLALSRALTSSGVATEVICSTGWPRTLDFLPGVDRVVSVPSMIPDAIVLVDCATIDRCGADTAAWIRAASAPVVNIDHHRSNSGYGAVACVDDDAAATSEVVAELIHRLAGAPDRDGADLLLAGILHDTDGLRAPGTDAGTLRLVAELVDAGGDLCAVANQLFGQRPIGALRLWGGVMATLELALGGRIVIGTMSQAALKKADANMLDAEDLPDLLATTRDADVAVLLRELDPSTTRVSIRTNTAASAAAIAATFGGGGHDRAAGCTLPVDVDSARSLLIEACQAHIADAPGMSNTTGGMSQ